MDTLGPWTGKNWRDLTKQSSTPSSEARQPLKPDVPWRLTAPPRWGLVIPSDHRFLRPQGSTPWWYQHTQFIFRWWVAAAVSFGERWITNSLGDPNQCSLPSHSSGLFHQPLELVESGFRVPSAFTTSSATCSKFLQSSVSPIED